MRRTSALIVGGGPAGAAAAIALARSGTMPVVIERSESERDVVCGGFLGWDALAALRRLGVDPAALGARPIHRLRLIDGKRTIETDLPQAAAGLSRRRLDGTLLRRAEEAGASVLRGRAARALDEGCVRLDDGEALTGDAIFLATGKHELRGAARELGGKDGAVGLRTALAPSPALDGCLAGTIELHLFDRGYAGLLLQEDGSANFCLSIARSRLAEAGGPQALIADLIAEAPRLAARLDRVPSQWEAVAGVPYGWRAREGEAGLFRLGDQAAVIASLVGDGIAIALNSGMAAASSYMGSGPGAAIAFQRDFSAQAARPVRLAEALRALAEHRGRRRLFMALARVPGVTRAAARLTRIG
ncbi:MAG TPA: FAD-dependent monooxygenase [Allosphingosinicella sp.]